MQLSLRTPTEALSHLAFSMSSTSSSGCRTRAARLPSPSPLSPTQLPPSAPHTRMHMCSNRVNNPYPSTPSITPSTNQSSAIIHHQPSTINHHRPPSTKSLLHLAPTAHTLRPTSPSHLTNPSTTAPRPKKPTHLFQPKPSAPLHSHTDQSQVACSARAPAAGVGLHMRSA